MTVVLALAASPGTRAAEPGSIGLSLTAQPSAGPAPLLVDYHASLTPSNLAAVFWWAFGDGSTYQQSAVGGSTPTHAFAVAGTYTTSVWANSSSGDQSARLSIVVGTPSLAVDIQATPDAGPSPLTVHFVAGIVGGSGTFTAVIWRFGDGSTGSGADVLYTYATPGTYTASVNVTDSDGANVSAQQTVTVTDGAGSLPASTPPDPNLLAIIITLILVGLAAALAVARWLVLRGDAVVRGSPRAALPEPAQVPAPPVPAPEELQAPPVEDSTPAASRRLSERILVHLYWFGRPTADGSARVEATQHGMGSRLGAGQNSISKSLSRLREAGLVKVSVEHVPGLPRRVRTYALTPRGETLVRNVRREWKGP